MMDEGSVRMVEVGRVLVYVGKGSDENLAVL